MGNPVRLPGRASPSRNSAPVNEILRMKPRDIDTLIRATRRILIRHGAASDQFLVWCKYLSNAIAHKPWREAIMTWPNCSEDDCEFALSELRRHVDHGWIVI